MATYFKIKDCLLDTGMQQSQPTPTSSGGGTASPCVNPFGTSDIVVHQNSSGSMYPVDPGDPAFYSSVSRIQDKTKAELGIPEPDLSDPSVSVNYVKVRITNLGGAGSGFRYIKPSEDVNVRICCPGRTQFTLGDFRIAEGVSGMSYFVKPNFIDTDTGLSESDLFQIDENSTLVLVYGISDAQLLQMRSYGTHFCCIAEIFTQERYTSSPPAGFNIGDINLANCDPDGAPSGAAAITNVAWGYRRLAQRNIDRVVF